MIALTLFTIWISLLISIFLYSKRDCCLSSRPPMLLSNLIFLIDFFPSLFLACNQRNNCSLHCRSSSRQGWRQFDLESFATIYSHCCGWTLYSPPTPYDWACRGEDSWCLAFDLHCMRKWLWNFAEINNLLAFSGVIETRHNTHYVTVVSCYAKHVRRRIRSFALVFAADHVMRKFARCCRRRRPHNAFNRILSIKFISPSNAVSQWQWQAG